MSWLVLGLIVFLGMHSVRIVAEPWRLGAIDRFGLNGWKAVYSLVSLVGLVLIIWGFAQARQQPVVVWQPAVAFKHLNSLFTLAAFILVVAAYVPRNHFKAWLHHPMIIGVALWALGHLLATAMLADVVLFGAFLAWAILDWLAAVRRDRAARVAYGKGSMAGTGATLLVGIGAWAGFAFWAHRAWIGVAPF
ncbi:MAG: NnrU family protein [Ottowia sp.]|nr:NnrU family protein [Ottowia sp.]